VFASSTQQEINFHLASLKRRPVGDFLEKPRLLVVSPQDRKDPPLQQSPSFLGCDWTMVPLRSSHQARINPIELGIRSVANLERR
jgi:hypothetical protein